MTGIQGYVSSQSNSTVTDVSIAATTGKSSNVQTSNSQVGTVATVSSLAQQISDAATRAAARDAKIGGNGLAAAATSIVDKLVGQTYQANKAANDAEVPKTDDPTLLARAKLATDSINGKASNPFAGLSRDQLALIAYDEGGAFTVNERKAALNEAQNQESQWRQQTVAKAMSVYKGGEGANSREAGKQLLDHLKSLSPIEQAQYPQSYAVQLQVMAESGATYSTASPLDALKFLSQLNRWATTPEADGLPSVVTADVGVLPKPDLAKFEADASLSRNELMAKYEKAVRSLPSMKSADLPRSNDPDRLAQALKATDYAWGNGSSPFASLTRNEVVAIYYDDSGTYTRDERMAAVKQLNEIDRNLWDGPTTKAANTGDWREVTEMGLKNYDDTLPIEKMRYPADYKMQLQQLLAYDNAKAGGALSKEQKKTLLEMMDALNRHQPETAPESTGKGDVARPWNDSWSAKLADLVRHAAHDDAVGSAPSEANIGSVEIAATASQQA